MTVWLDPSSLSWTVLALLVLVGFIGLTFGGDFLCRGAVGLSRKLGVSPLVIGLTVVSIATSMPELFTSVAASLRDAQGLVIGNIVGSNISNLGLILGLSALFCPLVVQVRVIRREMPALVLITLLFCALAYWGGGFTRLDGLLLLLCLVGYLFYFFIEYRQQPDLNAEIAEEETPTQSTPIFFLLLGGTVFLTIGADALVIGASEMALRWGVSEVLIGLSLVAIGTSLPELATSVAAALRKQMDICVGNIIGSNVFNLVLIGGVTALVFPFPVEALLLRLEIPIMLGLTLLLWPFVITGKIISRREGAILLLLFTGFLLAAFFFRLGG
ncbi:MAG: calcium/sodium antiporter [Opitutales bacterium]|nr:calcium/sodium antiporter [Opitutales bacterium]